MADTTVQSEISAFAHKVLYAHLGIFVLLIGLLAGGAYFGLRSYDKALAHAEALQQQFNVAQAAYVASQKQLTDLLATDAAQRAVQTAQQATLEAQIVKRDSQPQPPVITQALTPSASTIQVAEGLQSAYGFQTLPEVTPDNKIALEPQEAQETLSAKVNLVRFSGDLQDETQLYTLEVAKNSSLSNDLTQCQTTEAAGVTALAAANKSLAAYDKLAHRSKFRKILGSIGRNAERIGIAVVAFEVGHRI